MTKLRFILPIVGLLLSISFVMAQSDENTVMTADNITALQSVAQIDFADTGVAFTTGWFALSDDGSQLAAATVDEFFHWNISETGAIAASEPINLNGMALLDVKISDANQPVGVFSTGEQFQLFNLLPASAQMTPLIQPEYGIPLSLWLHGQDAWLEAISPDPDTGMVVTQYPALLDVSSSDTASITSLYAPAADLDAIVRIGRIPPPYVVTSSETGIVKLWHLETGSVLAEVDNGTGSPAVFGNINASATHLAWRDESSENLYLLDFATGENRRIASLNGEYVQWFFLSSDASIILAINQNFEPVIAAWDVATGERTVLGTYRQCNRPQPDMARLSQDGTTLVIGCDTGLEVWRIR